MKVRSGERQADEEVYKMAISLCAWNLFFHLQTISSEASTIPSRAQYIKPLFLKPQDIQLDFVATFLLPIQSSPIQTHLTMEGFIGNFGGANSTYVLVPDQRTAQRQTLIVIGLLTSCIIVGLLVGIGGCVWKKRRDARKIKEITGRGVGPRDAWGA